MKLTITDDNGVVLDQTRVTRAEWDEAQNNALTAAEILRELKPGDEAT